MFKKTSEKTKTKHIFSVVASMLLVCLVSTGAVYDATSKEITITQIDRFNEIEKTDSLKTRQENVLDFLSENNIIVGENDYISVDTAGELRDMDEIVLKRGLSISITSLGTTTFGIGTNKKVSDVLLENGFFLDEDDYSIPELGSDVYENMNISIVYVNHETRTREEAVDFETIYENDSTLEKGKTVVKTAGSKGTIEITEEIVLNNGEVESTTEISRKELTSPINKVISVGTAPPKVTKTNKAAASKATPAPKEATASKTVTASKNTIAGYTYSKVLTMNATAYSSFSGEGGSGITASGQKARYGLVAVDPKVIPLGTKLYVEGYGYAVAADTGGAIKGNKIDLCFEKSNSELKQFGRKNLSVYILS